MDDLSTQSLYEDISLWENSWASESETDKIIFEKLSLHADYIEVDVSEFLDLLKNSLSLNVTEKKRVVDSVPVLSQFQFDELKKVFLEERVKFRELAWEHPEDIKKLLVKQQNERLVLGWIYINEDLKEKTTNDDQQKIDELRKSLWL